MDVKIKRALISVSDKTGVVEFAKALSQMGVEINKQEKIQKIDAVNQNRCQPQERSRPATDTGKKGDIQ